MYKISIPPPAKTGKNRSQWRPKIDQLKPGQHIECSSRSEQTTVYNCGKRMGRQVAKRTVDGNYRVYLLPVPTKKNPMKRRSK